MSRLLQIAFANQTRRSSCLVWTLIKSQPSSIYTTARMLDSLALHCRQELWVTTTIRATSESMALLLTISRAWISLLRMLTLVHWRLRALLVLWSDRTTSKSAPWHHLLSDTVSIKKESKALRASTRTGKATWWARQRCKSLQAALARTSIQAQAVSTIHKCSTTRSKLWSLMVVQVPPSSESSSSKRAHIRVRVTLMASLSKMARKMSGRALKATRTITCRSKEPLQVQMAKHWPTSSRSAFRCRKLTPTSLERATLSLWVLVAHT